MLARFHSGLELRGLEAGRSGDDNVVDARHLQRLLVGVKAAETLVFRNSEVFFAAHGLLRKEVRDGDDFSIHSRRFDRCEKVFAGATTAAADANNDRVYRALGLRMENGRETCRRNGACRCQGRVFEELPPR